MKEKILVSACLLGETCRYDGSHNDSKQVHDYVKDKEVFLVCPERLGGLTTPRLPCEILHQRVINKQGEDQTDAFIKGAEACLKVAKQANIKKAILKANSPSCGSQMIYDGTFSGKKIKGKGICASLLSDNGIEVIDENQCLE